MISPLRHHSLCVSLALAFSAIASTSFAAPKIDLERITPVPANEQIPIQDFFRPSVLQEPKLNLSGTHIAAVVTAGEDKHQLLVNELGTQNIEMVSGRGDKDVSTVYWLDDKRLMFSISSQKLYGLGLLAAEVGSISSPYPLLQYYGTRVIDIPYQDRLRPLVWNRYDLEAGNDQGAAIIDTGLSNGKFVDITTVGSNSTDLLDARDNNERHVLKRFPVPEKGITYSYLSDKDGGLAFAFTSDKGTLRLFRFVKDHWELSPVDLEQIDVIACGEKPGQLVVMGPRQEGKPRALQFMDGATGELGEVLLQDEAYDFYGWVYRDRRTQTIAGLVFQQAAPQVVWFREDYRELQKTLDGFFPGLVVRIVSTNEEMTRILVATYSDRQPSVYHWVDLKKRTAGLIKSSSPWIDPARMQSQKVIRFKTRDGRKLDAYLTLPAGASKKNPAPLVVLPHGGPWFRDSWGFDGEVQLLASRGYAVLQPNYRGSDGTNWMFPKEDEWDFRKMHDDVTDATKTLANSGYVDRTRIAIMGGSFGGYLAISGVVNEPTLYRCAVTIAGVFDWEMQLKDKKFDQYDNHSFGRMMRKLGDPKTNREKFDAISPLRHVDQIKVPVFVSAGKEDQTVEIEQARALLSALGKYKVPHEKLIVGEEGHGMRHLKNQVELYTRILAFLEANMKPLPAAAPAP